MHEEILSAKQKDILSLIGNFSDDFGLIGGTAIALQLGHRRSLDFDLLTLKDLDTNNLIKSQDIFAEEFNEKLFREQLAYFQDIDYSESIDYTKNFETDPNKIKKGLEKISLQKF